MSAAAWMLLMALVIGAINVATRFVGDHMELLRLRFQQSKEERGLQIAWLRQHNEERYGRVKDWVIDVMKVVDPRPIAALSPSTEYQSEEDKPRSWSEMLDALNAGATEVKVFANSDGQLAQELEAFIDIVEGLPKSEGPEQIREQIKGAHSAGAAVVNRVYQLMVQLPNHIQPRKAWWRRIGR